MSLGNSPPVSVSQLNVSHACGLEGALAGHACISDRQHWSHCLSDLLAPGAFSSCLDSLGLAELRDHRRAFYGIECL